MNFELKPYLSRKQALINQALKDILGRENQARELIMAMDHSLMAGGKRLRPVLCLAAARICGKDPMIALPAGCAIEMIHTYSLIHDDLPAMDNDDLRRGLPTCHKQFSEATAILAGDALLTHAFYVLSHPQSYFKLYPDNAVSLALIGKISRAAGINGMVEGQILDMQAESFHSSACLEHLKKIHALKTGKMIRVSVEAGAVSADATVADIEKLLVYADNIGLAFQIADDILNIEGNPEIMGKASGSDAMNDKMTFPAVIGVADSKKYAKELIEQALDMLEDFDAAAADPLRAIAVYIVNRDR